MVALPVRTKSEPGGALNSERLPPLSMSVLYVRQRNMKLNYYTLLAFALSCLVQPTYSASPPTHTPPSPPVKAADAIRLADEYVQMTFPDHPELYCSDLAYDNHPMRPVKTEVWRLRYLLPNNPRREVEGSPHPDWGMCLVYVHEDGSVTHTAAPRWNPSNPEAEQDSDGNAVKLPGVERTP